MVNSQTIKRRILHLVLSGVLLFSLGAIALLPQPVSAAGEQALSFDWMDNYVDCGDTNDFGTEDFTIELWVKYTERNGAVLSKGSYGGIGDLVFYDATGEAGRPIGAVNIKSDDAGLLAGMHDNNIVTLGQWYYFAITREGTTVNFYLDGALIETDEINANYDFSNAHSFIIGAREDATSKFLNGLVDEVRLSNTVRTPAEIAASWNGGVGERFVVDADTLALWHMDEGSGDTIFDETDNNCDGTIYGGPIWVAGFPFPSEGPPPISQIVFTNPERTVLVNEAAEMTIETQDGGSPVNVAAATTINLTSTSGAGEFSLSPDPWAPTTSVVIPALSSNATFYYKDNTIGTPTITATGPPEWTPATQVVTVQGPVRLWRAGILNSTYLAIQEAIDNANDGDEITVFPGTYYEQIRIHKQITVKSKPQAQGGGAATTIIDAQFGKDVICDFGGDVKSYPAVWIQRDGVEFGDVDMGFTIMNTPPMVFPEGEEEPSEWGVAILANAPGCTIRGNIIEDSNPLGIWADVEATIISQNTVEASIFGIYGGGGGGSILYNDVDSGYWGILVESSQGNNNVSNNTVSNTWGGAIAVQSGDNHQITNNELYDNQGMAISLQNTSNATVSGNLITTATTDVAGIYGIDVEGGQNNTISNNTIEYVLIGGISLNNTSENNLYGNEIWDIYGYDLSGVNGGDANWTREESKFDRFSVKMETGEDPEGEAWLEMPTIFPFQYAEIGGALYFWAYLKDWTLPTYQLELDNGVILEANTGGEGLGTGEWLKLFAVGGWTHINTATPVSKSLSDWITQYPDAKVVKISVVYTGAADRTMYIDGSKQEGMQSMPMEPPKGIVIGRSNRNSVSNSTVSYVSGAGVLIVESHQNMLGDSNTISNNGSGIVIENSNENKVSGSTISNNYQHGILVMRSYNNQIIGNDITGNTGGMSGVHLDGESDGNEIHANNIVDNTPRDGEGNIIRDGEGNIISYGVFKEGGWVNATGNWWGDASGPYHERENPGGMGDAVSDFVHFGPQANTPLPEFIAPTIVDNLAMPRMTAVLGMFMGDVGPEETSLVVEAYDNEGGVGIAQVTVNLASLLIDMTPEVIIPLDKQEEWDKWLSELERSYLGHRGNDVYQRDFELQDDFMNQLRWYLDENDIQRIMCKLTLGDFSIPVTVTDWCGNEVSTGWSPMPSPTSNMLFSVWGSSGSDVFAVGSGGTILHYDGSSWSPLTSGTINFLCDVWGSSGSDVFAVGYAGIILHYDGSSWSPLTSGTTEDLRGVWGSSGSDVFAVGKAGTIVHYDGTTWSVMSTPALYNLNGVWGSSGSDVFAVGDAGRMFHYDGTTWSLMESGIGKFLASVWGSSGSDVFAVGGDGTILHYDGTTWSPMTSGTTNWLNSVWGSSGSDVFAAGIDGTILHYDGTTWSPMTSSTIMNRRGVWGGSGRDVFAVGDLGTIVHYYSPVDLTIVDVMQPLKEGWNLVSTPVTLDDNYATLADIVALGDGLLCDDAIRYDPTLLIPGWVDVAPLDKLKPMEAIYVHATGNDQIGVIFNRGGTSPPMLDLVGGWNLVGLAIPPAIWDSMPVNEAMVTVEDASGNRGYSVVVSPDQRVNFNDKYQYQDSEDRDYGFGGYGWNFQQNLWVYTLGSEPSPDMSIGGGYWVFMEASDTLAGFSTTPVTRIFLDEPGDDIPMVPRYDWERNTRTDYEEYRDEGYTRIFLTYSGDVSPSRVVEFYRQRMAEYGWELTAWEGSEDSASLDFALVMGDATASCHIDVVGGESIKILFELWEPGVDLPDVLRFEWGPVAMTAYSQTTDDFGTQTNISYEGEFYRPESAYNFYRGLEDRLREEGYQEYNWERIGDECQNEFAWLMFKRGDEENRTYLCLIWAERGLIEIEHYQFAASVPGEYIGGVIDLLWQEIEMRKWEMW